jgi:serine/threonine protein kinase
MVSVRLVIVLVLYALLVTAALVTITVVFSVLSRHAMNNQVRSLAKSTMSTIKRAASDEISSYQMTTYNIAMLLGRLNLTPPIGTTGQLISDYVATWDIMTIPHMNKKSTFLSTFGMWLDTATNMWYMTGCNRQTLRCSLYDAASNTTHFADYNRSKITNPVNLSTVQTRPGAPTMYPRYLDAIPIHTEMDSRDWWSYLYIDYAKNVTTHTCKGVAVAKTTDYFYCTEYYTPVGAGNGSQVCKQLVGVTVEASEADTFSNNDHIAASTIFLTSTRTIDNVNGLCDPNAGMTKAINKFLAACHAELLSECPTYLDLGKPYVYSVLGYSQVNRAAFVIAGEVPHSFFFDDIVNSQKVAIVISVVMIVVVVVMSVVISVSIVVPISYICVSMKNASNLTYERQMAPITRYTIFYEVKQLCDSYLELRQALKDLKAFMPQGLLVGPEEAMDSTSLLSALMGGGRYKSDDDDSGYGEDDDDDDDPDDVEMQLAGRAGGYSTPEVTISDDAAAQSVDAARRRSSVAVPTSPSVLPTTHDVFGNNDSNMNIKNNSDKNDFPLPFQRRRSTVHNGNYMNGNGIVSVVAVSTVEDALARDAALQKKALRKTSSVVTPGVSPRLSQQQQPKTQDNPDAANPRRQSAHVKLPSTTDSSVDRRVKYRNGYSTLYADSSRGEGNSLRLNRSVYNGGVNKFRSVNCTLVCIRFSFEFIDEHSLESEVGKLMDILIRTILRYGGVIEIFRPDVIIVSFGAHAVMSMHTQRATAAATTITKKLTVAQRARTRIIVDTGSFYCGTCGAHDRVSPVLFGERFNSAVELLRYEIGQGRLIVTGRVALCLPGDLVVPFDNIVTLRDRSRGCQLFLVLNPSKRNKKGFRESVDEFRRAYALAISGKYSEALEIVSRGGEFDPELSSYCVTTIKYLLTMNPPRPRYCRFQLPSFEPLGVKVKERVPKYQHDRLHLNELEHEDEGPISINFGFGGGSSSNTIGTSGGGAMDGANQSFHSHVFNEDGNQQHHPDSPHESAGPGAKRDRRQDMPDTPSMQQRRCSPSPNQDTTTAVRSFTMTDDFARSPSDRMPINESWSRLQSEKKAGYASSTSRAGDTGRTASSEDGLPLVFTDHKGERWHRFPSMIGSGAFAEVYKAISENGSLMALKCIHLAATHVQLADVVVEVNTACKLFSDFIVNHIGWAHVGSYMIIIMDYMSGGSLHSAISAFPSGMTLQVARRYASDALQGLAYLHRNGIVHADFKPQNILLAVDGGCRLSDFGSSVTKANAQSVGGDVFHLRGTPAYMSPEVARGDAPSMRSDMWSYGITLYEILTGRQPWVMKKVTGLPAVPEASLLAPATNSSAAAPPPRASASTVNMMEDLMMHAVSDVYGVKVVDGNSGSGAAATATAGGGVDSSNTNDASRNSTTAHTVVAVAEEWVPAQGLSDVRFVQGIANGSLRVRIDPKDVPTLEGYRLIEACLQESPQMRPLSWEVIDHPFFFY